MTTTNVREALEALFKNPHGCAFCDSGKLRKSVKDPTKLCEHDEACGFQLAAAALAAPPAQADPEALEALDRIDDFIAPEKAEAVAEVMRLAHAYAAACVDFEKASVAQAIEQELRATMLGAEKALQARVIGLARPTHPEQKAEAAVPAEILAIAQRLHTQDNRITQDPLFAVQQKRRIYGMDEGYCDTAEWVLDGETWTPEDEEDPPDGARRVGYIDKWEFVTGCFTEQGCKDFIAINGHNLHEPRIYAYGSYRNAEWIALRKWLMGIATRPTHPKQKAEAAVPADVLKAAQFMVNNDYRGPLAYARKVFDWVAAAPSPTGTTPTEGQA